MIICFFVNFGENYRICFKISLRRLQGDRKALALSRRKKLKMLKFIKWLQRKSKILKLLEESFLYVYIARSLSLSISFSLSLSRFCRPGFASQKQTWDDFGVTRWCYQNNLTFVLACFAGQNKREMILVTPIVCHGCTTANYGCTMAKTVRCCTGRGPR